jgi:predicted ArsR family transcriptional regulator
MSGPLPQYRPKFGESELRQAREMARKEHGSHAQVRRARLALELARDPAGSSSEIGRRVGMHAETVRRWRKRWTREGFSLEDKPRPGRPKSFSPAAGRADEGHRV